MATERDFERGNALLVDAIAELGRLWHTKVTKSPQLKGFFMDAARAWDALKIGAPEAKKGEELWLKATDLCPAALWAWCLEKRLVDRPWPGGADPEVSVPEPALAGEADARLAESEAQLREARGENEQLQRRIEQLQRELEQAQKSTPSPSPSPSASLRTVRVIADTDFEDDLWGLLASYKKGPAKPFKLPPALEEHMTRLAEIPRTETGYNKGIDWQHFTVLAYHVLLGGLADEQALRKRLAKERGMIDGTTLGRLYEALLSIVQEHYSAAKLTTRRTR